jgi:hypothetical protein
MTHNDPGERHDPIDLHAKERNRTNPGQTPGRTGGLNAGRIVGNAAAAVGRAIVTFVAYRAALKRLEAGVEGDLFDNPVLWAELKSAAWAEAGAVAATPSKARPI